jgi:hypothetical protein
MVPIVVPCEFTAVSEELTPAVFSAGDYARQAVRADKCSDVSEELTPAIFSAGDHARQAVRADKCFDVSEKYSAVSNLSIVD